MYTINEKAVIEIDMKESSDIFEQNVIKVISEAKAKIIIIHNYSTLKYVKLNNALRIAESSMSIYTDEINENNSFYSLKSINIMKHFFNYNEIKKYDIIQLDIDLSYENEQIIDTLKNFSTTLIQEDIPILLEFIFSSSKNKSITSYREILEECPKIFEKAYLSTLYKSASLVLNHPCNAYICTGHSCHSNKTNYPRYLYINRRGIQPYKTQNSTMHFMKNIDEVNLKSFKDYYEKIYINSSEHIEFIEANRRVFEEYIIVPFLKILPWNLLL